MTGNSNNSDSMRDLRDAVDEEPQSKRGKQGQAKHDHERAGPNSEEYGRTIASQKGDLRGTDVARGS